MASEAAWVVAPAPGLSVSALRVSALPVFRLGGGGQRRGQRLQLSEEGWRVLVAPGRELGAMMAPKTAAFCGGAWRSPPLHPTGRRRSWGAPGLASGPGSPCTSGQPQARQELPRSELEQRSARDLHPVPRPCLQERGCAPGGQGGQRVPRRLRAGILSLGSQPRLEVS